METKFKGTPGKWKCSEVMNFSDTLISFISADSKEVAQLRGCENGEEIEAKANAKLISKAPEMLEMLEKVRKYYNFKANNETEIQLNYEMQILIKEILE